MLTSPSFVQLSSVFVVVIVIPLLWWSVIVGRSVAIVKPGFWIIPSRRALVQFLLVTSRDLTSTFIVQPGMNKLPDS